MEQSNLVDNSDDKRKKTPDWERFGLSNEQRKETEKGQEVEGLYQDNSQRNELFSEDQSARSKPWWMSTFFITEPVLFGTWDGVFTSCMINIFGVVIFLRTGWMVVSNKKRSILYKLRLTGTNKFIHISLLFINREMLE